MEEKQYRCFELIGDSRTEFFSEFQGKIWPDYVNRLKELLEHCGTTEYSQFRHPLMPSRIAGVRNEGQQIPGLKPDKDHPELLVPDRRTKAGRELDEWMKSVREPAPDGLIRKLGLKDVYSEGYKYYSYGMHQIRDRVFIAIRLVPEVEKYEPHADLIEIKYWEYLRIKDEYEAEEKAKQKESEAATL